MKLSVIGLGKLGACTAACFAYKGIPTIGVDINADSVNAINAGKAPVFEPRLQELIQAAGDRLEATLDFDRAIQDSEVTFIVVPTPSRDDGHFSNAFVEEALADLASALKKVRKKYHLFVITSTVSPGVIEGELIPLVASVSGKKVNKDFGFCYNPEFIALGSVISDFLNPDLVLIGESDPKAGDLLSRIYEKVCDNKPQISRMSIPSAEVTKISLNSFVTMKISFANTLANICERIPGANIDDITRALGADKRISPFYLRGGLSFGGPCFPRDNKAFSAFAREAGVDAFLAQATDEVNEVQVDRVAEKILQDLPNHKKPAVAILGLSYKPNTPVIEESPSIKIIEKLLQAKDLLVEVYDPVALENTRAHFGDRVRYSTSLEECVGSSPICVVATPDKAFRNLRREWFRFQPTTIFDCWRILDRVALGNGIRYLPLGISVQNSPGVFDRPVKLVGKSR
ncbi:MAG: UDP-glucose 6-dehydrogenase [Nitrospinae bacterium CG11_big_fil_rev_8_21_14_0_20_56_8]|nr:MAG: UDP-glucose 6-dehydrogenase [Nitrospinae bacterium CG11_big_fil_rev_8_21_14_0_20_56_8]